MLSDSTAIETGWTGGNALMFMPKQSSNAGGAVVSSVVASGTCSITFLAFEGTGEISDRAGHDALTNSINFIGEQQKRRMATVAYLS